MMKGSVIVRSMDDADSARWDAFVERSPEGTFFHLSGWRRVVEACFGHRPHYLLAERDGEIAGVLPLVHVKSRLFGNSLVSNAFCVYGGPAADDGEARAALLAEAEALMSSLGADHVELRCRAASGAGWIGKSDLYVTFRKPIDGDDDKNMRAIPRKQRAMVRKGIDAALAADVEDGVGTLHRIYAESVRNLGTPVFPKRYFASLAEEFGDRCEVLVIRSGREPVAGVMSFFFRDEVLPYYGGGTERARQLAGNDFMYWQVMRRAAARGCRVFDFGRSKVGTGAFSFKKNWGFAPEPLHHEFKLKPGREIPNVNPLNPKYRLFIEAWKRLPLPVANRLGPLVVRGLA